MGYCKKCSRILDEDSKECPVCGKPDDTTETTGSVLDTQLSDLEKLMEQNKNGIQEQETTTQDISSDYKVEDRPHFGNEQSAPTRSSVAYYTPAEEQEMSTALKVVLVISLIFMSLSSLGVTAVGGIVMAVYFMKHTNKSYRSFGLIFLIISLVLMVVGALCCCVMMGSNIFSDSSSLYIPTENFIYDLD